MQLLQKLRDSSHIEQITRSLAELEKRAHVHKDRLLDFLSQSRGNTIIYSYTSYGYIPASLVYWYSLTFSSPKHPLLAEAEEASIYILPYRDDVSILVFSPDNYSKLVQALQTARILEIDYLVFTIDPGIDSIRSILRDQNIIILSHGSKDPIESTLEMTMTSFIAISEFYRESLSMRGKRLFIHGREGFSQTLQSFIETYAGVLESILRQEEIYVTSTRFLEAPSLLFTHVLRSIGLKARYIPLPDVSDVDHNVIALLLSTDERLRKELRSRKPGQIRELVLNLDPLEAILYLAILSYTIHSLARLDSR